MLLFKTILCTYSSAVPPTFKLYHYNTDYNTAKFRGDIPQMPADTYTYYAVSPVPSESDGTQATYLIPDVQDGGFNGDWDVMVADPVK